MKIGYHLMIDSLVTDANICSNAMFLETCFRHVFDAHRMTVLDFRSHTFPGYGGVTGVFLLSESHASFHTWPEHRLICCDVFACGTVDVDAVSRMLMQEMRSEQVRVQIVSRGTEEVSSNCMLALRNGESM